MNLRTGRRAFGTAWRKRIQIAQWLDDLGEAFPAANHDRDESFGFRIHSPSLDVCDPVDESTPFMASSTCSARDFLHPEYGRICQLLGQAPVFHRKQWEFVYIFHHLTTLGVVSAGHQGIGFGVGQEPLPAAFAELGASVIATDAPPEIGRESGWASTNEYASGLDALPWRNITEHETVKSRIEFQYCDMTAIPAALNSFDFCWSACCFEHLGSLQAGMDFVLNAVENVLKPGGVAVHTTEFNLSSNSHTIASGSTVIYRRRDMEALASELTRRGHEVVQRFSVAPDSHYMDGFVDLPPYRQSPHLKLALFDFTTTSVGIVVRRGG